MSHISIMFHVSSSHYTWRITNLLSVTFHVPPARHFSHTSCQLHLTYLPPVTHSDRPLQDNATVTGSLYVPVTLPLTSLTVTVTFYPARQSPFHHQQTKVTYTSVPQLKLTWNDLQNNRWETKCYDEQHMVVLQCYNIVIL